MVHWTFTFITLRTLSQYSVFENGLWLVAEAVNFQRKHALERGALITRGIGNPIRADPVVHTMHELRFDKDTRGVRHRQVSDEAEVIPLLLTPPYLPDGLYKQIGLLVIC